MMNDPSDLDDKVQRVSKVGFCLYSNIIKVLENCVIEIQNMRSEFLYPRYKVQDSIRQRWKDDECDFNISTHVSTHSSIHPSIF